MKDVVPCGDDRVCFDEEVGYDGKSATVVALDVADGKQLWRYKLANTETIVPVGEALLVTTTMPDTKWPSTSRSTEGETGPGGASWLMPRL